MSDAAERVPRMGDGDRTTFRPGTVVGAFVAGGHGLECGSGGQRARSLSQGPLRAGQGAIQAPRTSRPFVLLLSSNPREAPSSTT